MKKSTLALIAIVALTLGTVLAWGIKQTQPIKLEAGIWFGDQARALPEFELIDHNGNTLTQADLQGKWQLLFFGYTHCPDICPLSLQTMADMYGAINDSDIRDALQVIFVSVDPDRDTPEILKSYVQYFNPKFIGVTGNKENLNRLTRAIGISYSLERTDPDQISYEVSHSSAFILLDPDSKFAGLFSAPQDSQLIANDIINLVEHY